MKNLLNPRWLFLVNTLPIALFFLLFSGTYTIIKSQLSEESIALWFVFGGSLLILGIANLIYTIYTIQKQEEVSLNYAYLTLIFYIPYVYLYNYNYDDIIPFSIPNWMLPDNIFYYAGTFLMPTLVYAILVLVINFTPNVTEEKAWKNFVFPFTIPIGWFFAAQVIFPMWQPFGVGFGMHFFMILFVISLIVFFFYFARGVYIMAARKENPWIRNQLTWKIIISIVFPLIGLFLNNLDFGIFGDFSHPLFYILAVVNGIVVSASNAEHKTYRLVLFIARSITFIYTFYFFIVFLPFLPLAMPAILLLGTGLLLLTPTALLFIHTSEISRDFNYLSSHLSKRLLWIIGLLSFLIIPILITVSYLNDRRVLHTSLDYVYSPDYSNKDQINKASLDRTLDVIRQHKRNRFGDPISNGQTPYLSSYFNWLVLDNLTISNTKFRKLEQIFFDDVPFELSTDNIQNDSVSITNISTASEYDEKQQAWRSWVDLEITNHNDKSRQMEYATTIDLPVGCWISDHYLYIEDRKEQALLAEKKSAMWVFSNIRNMRRDPSILYYLTGNKVAFRVFPFRRKEVRKTGIEFLHKEPITLQIDSQSIQLGSVEFEEQNIIETTYADYVPAKAKKQLERVQRQPYFHFLVDVSKGMED
ncbi:MAG: MSEP-CTERM sorting domain-containing protein, partial [Bacteroidota bacterium]